jgi:hypothetical protein
MASVKNMLKKFSQGNNVLILVAVVALGYVLYNYSQTKNKQSADAPTQESSSQEQFSPSEPLGDNEDFAAVNGIQTTQDGIPFPCSKKEVVDPAHLLPKNSNSAWAKLNPKADGSLEDVNLLTAGYHIGINTIGQSLRNANLQVRSEPANPKVDVGPWNGSTITSDLMRKPLEIGCGPSHCDR